MAHARRTEAPSQIAVQAYARMILRSATIIGSRNTSAQKPPQGP